MDRKYAAELRYWRQRHERERVLGNRHYERLMLAVAGRPAAFFAGKVIADFGCGPRGSLEWAGMAAHRYCIDVLVDEYRALGIDAHRAEYVRCSETGIPLPDACVDVLFSINALDHARDWRLMLREALRLVRPGGLVALSVNLDEPPTAAEPSTITLAELEEALAGAVATERQLVSNQGRKAGRYEHLFALVEDGIEPPPYNGSIGVAWVTGTRR